MSEDKGKYKCKCEDVICPGNKILIGITGLALILFLARDCRCQKLEDKSYNPRESEKTSEIYYNIRHIY